MQSTVLRLTYFEWAILFVAVAVRLTFALATGFICDDAFISFRYAENITRGLGFVYNAGERVLGTTSPSWTVLLSGGSALGLPIVPFAIAISLLCAGVSAVLVCRIGKRLDMGWAGGGAALFYALWPRSIMAETTGMESALFTALILAAVACAISRRDLGAVSFAALAALVRPEGFVLLLLCQLYVFVRDQKRGVSLVLVSVVILAPWFVFATWYFGSPLPSSIGGKLALYAAPGQSGMLERLSYVLALHSPVGSIITLLAVIGSILIVRHRFEFGVVLAFAFALVAGYTIAPTHIFFWYVAPIQPVIILTALACVHFTSRSLKLAESRAAAAAAALATVALATWGNFSMFESARWQQAQQEAIHLQLGLYLKGRVPDGAVVAAEDIGYIGYYSKCRILDRDGLVSPEVQQFNRDGRYYGVIEQFRPEWLVADTSSPISGFLAEVDFMRGYAIDTSIGHSGRAYHVFRRRN